MGTTGRLALLTQSGHFRQLKIAKPHPGYKGRKENEVVAMRKRSLALASIIALAWAGSLWMTFWSGFSAHVAVAVAVDRSSHKVRLAEDTRLLSMLERGNLESARVLLADSVALEGKLVGLETQIPQFGPMDFVFAGLTSSKEYIGLIQVAQQSERQPKRSPDKGDKRLQANVCFWPSSGIRSYGGWHSK